VLWAGGRPAFCDSGKGSLLPTLATIQDPPIHLQPVYQRNPGSRLPDQDAVRRGLRGHQGHRARVEESDHDTADANAALLRRRSFTSFPGGVRREVGRQRRRE
jgi:hypothetical protein